MKRKLGEGAFGIVYLAAHPQLGRDVALKVARRERFQSADDLDRFFEEARNSARIKAPGIVAVYDVVQDGDLVFIVQEYIDGSDLKETLRTGSHTPDQVADRIAEIAEAVGYSHQQGIYHCDLKPSDILLDKAGDFKHEYVVSVEERTTRKERPGGEHSGSSCEGT
ncbi:MAG: serine/threonine-protein kinase [Fuerstiella sp.]